MLLSQSKRLFPLSKASQQFPSLQNAQVLYCSVVAAKFNLQLLFRSVLQNGEFTATSYISRSVATWQGFLLRWALSLPQLDPSGWKYIWIKRFKRQLLWQPQKRSRISCSSPGHGASLMPSSHQNGIAFCLCPLVSSKNTTCGHVSTWELYLLPFPGSMEISVAGTRYVSERKLQFYEQVET